MIKASSTRVIRLRRLSPKEETVIKFNLSCLSQVIISEHLLEGKVQAHGNCMTFIISSICYTFNTDLHDKKSTNITSKKSLIRASIFMLLPFINPCCTIISNHFALVAQWIRALACGVRGRVFESRRGC